MLDHIGLDVGDYERSRSFYEQALAPLGLQLMMEPIPGIGGFGDGRWPFFWIGTGRRSPQSGVHVAFEAADRATVDAFHAAALDAGATDNGAPRRARDLPPELLRGLRPRPRREQRRGVLPPTGVSRRLDPGEAHVDVGELPDAPPVEEVGDDLDDEALGRTPQRHPADDQDALG